MKDIVKLISESGAKTIKGVSIEEIIKVEERLNFKFDSEYKEFLKKFGIMSIGSNEIYGLGVEGYLNVEELTIEERELHKNLEKKIVIQSYGIGDVLITLDEEGKVYESRNNENKKIYNSFYDYLEEEIIK